MKITVQKKVRETNLDDEMRKVDDKYKNTDLKKKLSTFKTIMVQKL